jgi:hypothetical protein
MKSTQAVISRTVFRHRLILVSALLLVAPLFADSQSARRPAATTTSATPSGTALSAATAQARRDQLAKIPELLADPDPNARIASMEAILDTNDATMIQLALRLAFQSDDANLRSLAMRAYIASAKELTFDILVPDTVKSQYDAVQFDSRSKDEFFRSYSYMQKLEQLGFRDHLVFQRYSRTESTGTLVDAKMESDPAVFAISGDRLSVRVHEGWNGYCYIDFRPSNNMTLQGTMSCEEHNGSFPKFVITSQLF